MPQVQIKLPRRVFSNTGTCESPLEAAQFIETVKNRRGSEVAYLKEIAFNDGRLRANALHDIAQRFAENTYGEYTYTYGERPLSPLRYPE